MGAWNPKVSLAGTHETHNLMGNPRCLTPFTLTDSQLSFIEKVCSAPARTQRHAPCLGLVRNFRYVAEGLPNRKSKQPNPQSSAGPAIQAAAFFTSGLCDASVPLQLAEGTCAPAPGHSSFTFAQFVIFRIDLLLPPSDQIGGYQQRTVGLSDALAVEVLLPMGPAFMFNRCERFEQFVE